MRLNAPRSPQEVAVADAELEDEEATMETSSVEVLIMVGRGGALKDGAIRLAGGAVI